MGVWVGEGGEGSGDLCVACRLLTALLTDGDDAKSPGGFIGTQPKADGAVMPWDSSWVIVRCALVTTCC